MSALGHFFGELIATVLPSLYPGPESRRGDAVLSIVIGLLSIAVIMSLFAVLTQEQPYSEPTWAAYTLVAFFLLSASAAAYTTWVWVRFPETRRTASLGILLNCAAITVTFALGNSISQG